MHSKPKIHCGDPLRITVIRKSQRIMQQITKFYGGVLPNNSNKTDGS